MEQLLADTSKILWKFLQLAVQSLDTILLDATEIVDFVYHMRIKYRKSFGRWICLHLQENGDRKSQPGFNLHQELFWIFIPGNEMSFS